MLGNWIKTITLGSWENPFSRIKLWWEQRDKWCSLFHDYRRFCFHVYDPKLVNYASWLSNALMIFKNNAHEGLVGFRWLYHVSGESRTSEESCGSGNYALRMCLSFRSRGSSFQGISWMESISQATRSKVWYWKFGFKVWKGGELVNIRS
jgi:hypothetical protein